jgi:sulfite dehydrogenase
VRRVALLIVVVTALVAVLAAEVTSAAATRAQAPSPKVTFVKSCGACHTMKAAGTKGKIGPNLDKSKPSKALVIARVTKGRGAMPSFKGKLTKAQIAALATYVAAKT